jgi:RepB DNA-primase N-terminal domain
MRSLHVFEARAIVTRILSIIDNAECGRWRKGRAVTDTKEAFRMLDAFASVGATSFDLTHTNIDGEKRGFRPHQSIAQLRNSLPRLFPGATERQNNIIVRPHSDTAQLIQLDDLKAEGLSRVGDVAFLTLRTSPGNHQAWIAVSNLNLTLKSNYIERSFMHLASA